MFASSLGQSQPAGSGLFGSTNTGNQQTGSGLFGLGQNTQNQQQTGSGLFGGFGQSTQNQQQTGGGLFGLGQHTQQNQSQQQPRDMFAGLGYNVGQNQQQQSTGMSGMFGGFGQSNQQQNNTLGGSTLGGSGLFSQNQQQQPLAQSQQGQLNNSLWQSGRGLAPREKSIPDQIATVVQKWDTGNPDCAIRHYFYNKVEESLAPYYGPAPGEDPKAWEEALVKKPGPGYVPVLCTGFAMMGERIHLQQRQLAMCNGRLHEINASLSNLLRDHDTKTSVRTLEAKRRHTVLRQRCLALASKVQVLRNRGYSLGGDEEDLKAKLQTLEKSVFDPGLGSRADEIWARMTTIQERVNFLKAELEKNSGDDVVSMDEESVQKAKKILEDYQTQMGHLRKEVEKMGKDYVDWEQDQGPPAKMAKVDGR